MSTECSRETSLRLTISQAVFFFFSSVLFPSSTFWHGAQRIQMSTLFIIIQYDFSDLLSILCGVFTKGKNDRIDKLLTPCKYLEIQHKGTKKTLSRWFCFTIYSFQFDRNIEVNFYQMQILHNHNRPNGLCIKKFDLDAACSKAKHCRNVFGHVLRPNFVISTQLVLNVGPWPF